MSDEKQEKEKDKDVLSQEEIDALLHSVGPDDETNEEQGDNSTSSEPEPLVTSSKDTSSDDSSQKPAKEESQSELAAIQRKRQEDVIRVVNFANQERSVRGELPVLDKIYDRAVRYFNTDIYQLMAKELQVEQEPLQFIKHREYLSSLPNPTYLAVHLIKPLKGKAIFCFDKVFIYDLVDYYFGGNTHFQSDKNRNDFTATEMRVMDIVLEKLQKNIEQAWAPIVQLKVVKAADETNPQLLHIAEPNEVLLVSKFNVTFGEEKGFFSFVVPYLMVEPLKQQLELGAARPDDEIDPNWINSLKEELMDVNLPVGAHIARSKSTLRRVLKWQEGDFVPLEKRDRLTLDIENIPCFEAEMGVVDDKRAVKIVKKITY
ncbi:flagellar motor switch protein FliM [Legionella sp. W05-934-2]|jgi:flagellar motor switch protein FliM|uniref:flagellar motor switch protein FliM n=1 Tax=Legionella sp. W05-934-2 TaxID=1198649 RepID=UPI003461C49B